MRVRFLSAAQRDLHDAFEWYEGQAPGLGLDLIAEVDRAVRRIAYYPGSCPAVSDGIRRVMIHRFPYGLWYGGEGQEIVVYAVAHLHRQPRSWKDLRG